MLNNSFLLDARLEEDGHHGLVSDIDHIVDHVGCLFYAD
jgi:hypothetical protein